MPSDTQPGRIQHLALFIAAYVARINQGETPAQQCEYVFHTFAMFILGGMVTVLLGRPPMGVVEFMDLGDANA